MPEPTAAERAATHPNPDNPYYDAARMREAQAGTLMVLAMELLRAHNRHTDGSVTYGATPEANRDPGTLAYAYATADPHLSTILSYGQIIAAAAERAGWCEFCYHAERHAPHCVRPF